MPTRFEIPYALIVLAGDALYEVANLPKRRERFDDLVEFPFVRIKLGAVRIVLGAVSFPNQLDSLRVGFLEYAQLPDLLLDRQSLFPPDRRAHHWRLSLTPHHEAWCERHAARVSLENVTSTSSTSQFLRGFWLHAVAVSSSMLQQSSGAWHLCLLKSDDDATSRRVSQRT